MGEQRFRRDAPAREDLLHDRVGHLLGRARGDGGLDQHQRLRPDLLGDRAQGGLQRLHVGRAGADVAQRFLEVVALHIDDHDVGELQRLPIVSGHERFLLRDAPPDQLFDLGVLRLDRRDAAVEEWNLPVTPGAGPLHADDELGVAPLLVLGVRHHRGHDRAHETKSHHHHHLAALLALA